MTKDTILRRLRALRAMTTANGCTEAEAMAAAEKAAAIMRDAGLSEEDLEISEVGSRVRGKGRAISSKLWPVIAYCTNTKSIVVTSSGGSACVFLGREPGPEIADYLRDLCDRAIKREVATFKATTWYRRRRSLATKRQAVADFTNGMVTRLASRLREVFADNIDEAAKDQAKKAFEARYSGGKAIKHPDAPGRYSEAANSGWVRGGSVPLSRGVASEKPRALTAES